MTETALASLQDQIRIFVKEFAESGDSKAAAVAAGVHPDRAAVMARQWINSPVVRQAYQAVVRSRYAEAGPIALNVLLKFAKNENDFCTKDLQLSAAKDLAARAGYNAKDMREADKETKDLREMSPEELRAVIAATEGELAGRAKPVNAPSNVASSMQVIDLEG